MNDPSPQPGSRLPAWLALAGVLAVALAVRLPGFTWGLPDSTHLFSYHPDEYHSLRGLLSLVLAGDLNPHFFNYGSLYLYLVAAAALLLHPGAALTAWAEQIATGQAQPLLRSWTLDARLLSLAASLATVYVVYLLGLRLFAGRAAWCIPMRRDTSPAVRALALTAAGLAALAPLSSLTARYGTVDSTQTLFTCLSLYFSVLLFTRPTWKTAAWAGVCAGLAASTKYNGALVLVASLLASLLAPAPQKPPPPPEKGRRRPARPAAEESPAPPGLASVFCRWSATIAGAVVAFLVTSPYTLLAWREATEGILFELRHIGQGENLAVLADPSGFLFHLRHLLAPGLGLPVLLAVAGTVWVLAQRRREWYPLLLFAAVWFVMIALAQVRYPRYELPLLAPLALLAAAPLTSLVRGRRLYQGALAAGALLALFWCGQLALGLPGPRPQDRALAQLLQASSPDRAVGFVEIPWFADPPVNFCNGGAGLSTVGLWRSYAREARPVVVTDLRSVASAGSPLPFFVTTDFGLGSLLRANDMGASQFVLGLARQYRATELGGVPLSLVPWSLGPDWRYPWPRLDLWQPKE